MKEGKTGPILNDIHMYICTNHLAAASRLCLNGWLPYNRCFRLQKLRFRIIYHINRIHHPYEWSTICTYVGSVISETSSNDIVLIYSVSFWTNLTYVCKNFVLSTQSRETLTNASDHFRSNEAWRLKTCS